MGVFEVDSAGHAGEGIQEHVVPSVFGQSTTAAFVEPGDQAAGREEQERRARGDDRQPPASPGRALPGLVQPADRARWLPMRVRRPVSGHHNHAPVLISLGVWPLTRLPTMRRLSTPLSRPTYIPPCAPRAVDRPATMPPASKHARSSTKTSAAGTASRRAGSHSRAPHNDRGAEADGQDVGSADALGLVAHGIDQWRSILMDRPGCQGGGGR